MNNPSRRKLMKLMATTTMGLFNFALNRAFAQESLSAPHNIGGPLLNTDSWGTPILATPVHSIQLNSLRVFDASALQEKLKSDQNEVVILSGLVDWSSVEIPEQWEVKQSHTEIIPIVSNRASQAPDGISINHLRQLLLGSSDLKVFMNGESAKREPVTKYIQNILGVELGKGTSEVDLADNYEDLGLILDNEKKGIAVGYRAANFEGKKLTKILTQNGHYTNGIPINHILFMKKGGAQGFLEDWENTLSQAIDYDLSQGAALLNQ